MSRQDRTDDSSPHRSDRFQRWRRIAVRTLGIVAAAALLLVATLVLALKAPSARQALLREAGEVVEHASGVHLTARDFKATLRRGELAIDDLVLRAAPDAPPFLRVSHVQAVVSWGALLSGQVRIHSLRLDGASADLGAPLPEPTPAADTPTTTSATIDIEQIVLTGGSLTSGALPANLEMWLDVASAAGIEIAGSYVGGDLRLELAAAPVVIQSHRRPPVKAALEAMLDYTSSGILTLESLTLDGDGLRLTTNGRAELGAGQTASAKPPTDLSFTVQAAPALLLPDLATGGRLDATGQVTIAGDRLTSALRLDVQELPAEILRPWIPSPDFRLEGTMLDIDADLAGEVAVSGEDAATGEETSSRDDPFDQLTGHAEVAWRYGGEQLVAASLRSLDNASPGIGLAFEATALPSEDGTRRITGELRAQQWLSLAEGELTATRIDLEVPDVEAAAVRLGLPPDLGGFRPSGEIRATADITGALLKPDLELEAAWLLDGETLAKVDAHTLGNADLDGPLLDGPLHLVIDADLLPEDPGRRRLTGAFLADDSREISRGELARAQLRNVHLDLELPDLEAAARDLREHWRRLVPGRDLPPLLAPESTFTDGSLTVTARGNGPVLAPSLEAEADWRPAADERAQIHLAGNAAAESPFFAGQARLRLTRLNIARFSEAEPRTSEEETGGLTGRVTATFDFEGDLDAHQATLDADVTELRSGEGVGLESARLAARSNGTTVDITSLAGTLTTGQTFSGAGHLALELVSLGEAGEDTAPAVKLGDGELSLEMPRPIATLERLIASLQLEGDTLVAEVALEGLSEAPASSLSARRPVALARVPLTALVAGKGEAWLGVSSLDLEPFLPLLGLAADAARPRATFDGSFTVNLSDPVASTGTIDVRGLALEGPEGSIEAVAPLRIELKDHRLELEPGRLLGSGGESLQASGALELAPQWRPGDDPAALATDVTLDLNGRFELSVLNPLLAGGRASGELGVALEVRGPPAAPRAEGKFDGSGVELFYAVPYVTRVEAPVVEIISTGDGARFTAQARLNGGNLEASGSLDRQSGLALRAGFQGVRYRLNYGLTTRLSGGLELSRPADGPRSRLSGDVILERGTLRNELALDRETVSQLLAPDLTSTEDASAYDLIDLDLSVTTADGVSVKNNLGELHADWGRLRVRGTLRNPLLSGRIDVDPGGKLTAYGQTLRIDEASIAFSGDSAAPRIVFETTSSLQDPSITDDRRRFSQTGLGDNGPGNGGYWERRQSDVDAGSQLTTGVLNHLTDRAAGSLSQGLARTELSLEPLQIFGETDTTARLTASQQISAEANLIYSINPRDAEGQTYILELHDADLAPSLTAQLFTNDDNNEGVTLQQTLQLGAGRRGGEQGRRLGGIRIHAPEEIEQRQLKQALGVRKRDPFPDDAEFDVEVDALAELQRQGYPGAEVKVTVESGRPELPVLDLRVEPGPRVRFLFDGTRPPGPARRSITQTYNLTVEEVALENMARATVKALRGQGYIEPSVEVTVEQATDEEAGEDRGTKIVRVVADGGRRIEPGPPRLEGVPPEVAGLMAGQFESLLARVELAAAEPGADRYLLQSLATVGYPEAQVLSRALSEDGETLTVRVEPGISQRLARVEILGLEKADAERLLEDLPVQAGDPIRSDLVTRAAHSIEDELRRRGHARATVRTSLEPLTTASSTSLSVGPGDLILRFEVDPGAIHHIAGVRLEGLHGTDRAWASRVAGLEAGSVFRDDDVGAARRRLTATGLFKGVRTTTGPAPDGKGVTPNDGDRDGDGGATLVTFDLEERPRYLLSYGGRWESGEEIGLVVDAVDRSFLGRGTTLGLRAIYSSRDDRSLRLYHAIPRVFGSRSSFEVFVEGKNEDVDGQLVSGVETWSQVTFPLSPRARTRFYLRYQDLFIEEAPENDPDGTPADTNDGEGRVVIPSIGWQFSLDTRDRALGARRPDGLFASFDLVGSHADLGSDVSVLGIFSQLKAFTSLADKQTKQGATRYVTWAQSVRIGLLEPFEDTAIPSVQRLRAGGEYSVRGYRRDSLGPLDAEDQALGGELFFIVNQELRFPLLGDWLGGLVFFDAGNVWASREALDSKLFTSAGIGLRAATPVGPLRLDIAAPLDRRPEIDDSVKFYVGFGHVF